MTFQNAYNCSYIKFRDTKIDHTKEFTNSIYADYDVEGNIVGLEFIGGLTRDMFNNIDVRILDEDEDGNIIKPGSKKPKPKDEK